MRIRIFASIIIIIGLIVAATPRFGAAIDTPHSASNNISCGDCHGAALLNSPFWGGSYSPVDIDDTVYNKLCLNCHRVTSGPYSEVNAPLVKTHSSLTTSNKYGDWTRGCRNCHDPHYQRQKNYKTTDASRLYLATGTITACVHNGDGTSTLTYSTITYKTGWDSTKLTKKTGDYRRTILFPNVSKLGYNYPLVAIDTGAKRITVTGDATVYLYPPTTFAATYGQYIKDIMDISADGSGVNKTVKFFDQTGTNSFADGDTMYNGVCEVCHTQTTHYRNDGSGSDQHHTNIGGEDGTNCTTCHTHTGGFRGSCDVCHGYPPPPLASIPLPTGSTTAGAHVLHVTTKGYQCSICHYNSAGSGSTHNNNKITLGFVSLLGAYTGGSYDGQTTANYQSSDAGTTVSKTGNKQCSNIYCHGGTMAPNGGTASAVWDTPSSAACGTCHGATVANPPLRGSHQKHAGSTLQLPCSDCHKGYTPTTIPSGMNTHVNNQANFAFDTSKGYIGTSASYNGTITMLDAYGQCSNVYCHGTGTPRWGGTSIACDGCHKASNILQGKHSVHYASATVATSRTAANNSSGTTYIFNCGVCHDPGATTHSGGAVSGIQAAQVAFDATVAGGGIYTASGTLAGNDNSFNWTAGACTTTYCHSPGTKFSSPYDAPNITSFTWNSAAGTLQCNGCHGNTTYSDYRKGAPLYATGSPKPNAHVYHVDSRITPTGETQCLHCHNATTNTNTTITGTDKHINKTYDLTGGTSTYKDGDNVGGAAVTVTINYTSGNPSTCSNVSCHPTGLAGSKSASVTKWNNAYSCTDCHKINMNNTAGYHHVMDSTAMSDRTYPTSVPTSSATDPNRKCTMCHVDHNILSPMLNASNTTGRSMNLRTAIGTTPTSTTGYTNSDYASGGGICISCHINELTKNTTAQKSVTSSTTMAVTDAVYSASAHQNNMTSTMSNGGSTFSSNCSKCHNVKNGETTTFQSSANKFGTHDSTGERLLFDTSDNFCFDCHTSTPYPNYTAIVNRSYNYRAGGNTADTLNNISSAFSLSSKHNLSDIKTFINGKWGYTSISNPCDACHNPHIVQGDPVNLPNATKSPGTRGWPVSRPNQHATTYNNQWGDAAGEKMSDYTTKYQAPYRKGSTTTFEPDGSSTQNGSNLTDFNNFCIDCHNTTYTIYSTTLGRNLRQIDWNNEIHGKGDPNDGSTAYSKLCGDAPYPSGLFGDPPTLANKKVLSCLDCHEPHGSTNVTLIRKEVNGNTLSAITSISQTGCGFGTSYTNYDKSMGNLCNRCHNDDNQIDGTCNSGGWYKIHHKDTGDTGCNTDNPYNRSFCTWCHAGAPMGGWACSMDVYPSGTLTPIGCICCHYHGSYTTASTWNWPDNAPKTRRTF